MQISYQIFKEEDLLIQKFSGIFSFQHYKQYSGFIIQNEDFTSAKKILIDFRDIHFEEIPDDFEETIAKIIKYRKGVNKKLRKDSSAKVLLWVDKPAPTVIANFLRESFSAMIYDYCSTATRIINDFKLPDHLKDLEKIVHSLENKFETPGKSPNL